ncbi:MAG: GHKL domain-containing protein [Lachnospiraceae bacterium]|nr:GHKL domain-containing protein [Lachnospiraceae bacterium]
MVTNMPDIVINILQLCLDAAVLTLCCLALFRERYTLQKSDILLFPLILMSCVVARTDYVAVGQEGRLFMQKGFEISLSNNIFTSCFLIIAVLMLASMFLKIQDGKTAFCGTMMVFSVYFLTRFFSVIFLTLCGANDIVMQFGVRLLAFILIAVLIFTSVFYHLRQLIQAGSFLVCITTASITVFFVTVLSLASFETDKFVTHLPMIVILLLALMLIDSILLFLNWRWEQERKQIRMIEQYVPVVEELISQVRARQHEFNNRLLAIEVAVSSAATLEEAQNSISELTKGLAINSGESALLSCDSKIISGVIFGKMKQAEMIGIQLDAELHILFRKTRVPETAWVEIIGILLDNAVEASGKGDTVYLRSRQGKQHSEVCVSNPYPAMSNMEFMSLFKKGLTTKAEQASHGYGLYNVLRIVERYHGKVITRNEQIEGSNYVVFGVVFYNNQA